ncbi:helix-turn-helix domain-containing protein [Paraburkholderia sp. CNPSo 3157]|uniref:Helix-turn-helix domain-containing protein n=2 Tax=Paraburkholderia franconis TaxID=2654983 RepID=A0A7X1NA74_9BURK|nr:helix-turn-helix domain-containing protein [Paraburkholderia franconis]
MPILADAEGNMPRVKVRKAVRWIGENFVRPISVTDIAAIVAMSERSLLRHFREEMGVSPSEFLSRERVECACRMLEETDLPVDTIARRDGTTSGDCMAKMFRRFPALSPSEYRQRHLHDRRTTAPRQSRLEPPVEARTESTQVENDMNIYGWV